MQQNYAMLFPFEKVRAGSRILIYGAGAAGQECLRQMLLTGYAEVVGFLDRNADKISNLVVPVYRPEKLQELDYDVVIVAFQKDAENSKICQYIQRLGVPPEKIIDGLPRKVVECSIWSKAHDEESNHVSRAYEAASEEKFPVAFYVASNIGDAIFCKSVVDAFVKLSPSCSVDLYAPNAEAFLPTIYYGESYLHGIFEGNRAVFQREASHYRMALDVSNLALEHLDLSGCEAEYKALHHALHEIQEWLKVHSIPSSLTGFVTAARAVYLGQNCYTWRNCGGALPIHDMSVHLCLDESYREFFDNLHFGRYITLNYASGNGSKREDYQAKQWSFEYYPHLVQQLKKEFPSIDVVQLGTADAEKIPGAGHYILGKNLAFVEHVLCHSLLHIDIEGGLVHLATQFGTKCLVLFGPTRDDFFGYPQNINLKAGACHGCFGIYPDFRVCARGLKVPACMSAITPEMVMEAARKYLESIGGAKKNQRGESS